MKKVDSDFVEEFLLNTTRGQNHNKPMDNIIVYIQPIQKSIKETGWGYSQ
jgi:hypothetical protein